MAEATIYGTSIEHNGDVERGLDYLEHNWNDNYVIDQFENSKRGPDYKAYIKVPGQAGTYVLKYLKEHHFSLSWVNEN